MAESEDVDKHLVTPQAAVLADLVAAESPAAVLIASSAEGKEVAARLAMRTRSGILTDAVGARRRRHRDPVDLRRRGRGEVAR